MLLRLFIRDVAIIDELEIEFGDGFNVLTGETGAGKSIIIDAVNLILGERASKELIKHDADKAVVEAVFNVAACTTVKRVLADMGMPEDDELILSRELYAAGKNICRVNGTLVTLTMLRQLTDTLVDVHGQHEHQSLITPNRHMAFLDAFAHDSIAGPKARVSQLYSEYRSIRSEQLSGFGSEEERAREMDILAFQINEIEAAKLDSGEEQRLLDERKLLTNAERIMLALENAYEALNGENGALTGLDAARQQLGGIASIGEEYDALHQRLGDAFYSLDDIAISLRDSKTGFEFDPDRLNAIEERLELISGLKRKYGSDIPAVLTFLVKAQERLYSLQNADRREAELAARLGECSARYAAAAAELTALRHSAAEALSKRLLAELSDLGLDKARFDVRFDDAPQAYSVCGVDKLEFMLSTNPGEPLKPLSKVASGGELSRIMLAFKAIFAAQDEIGTLIFDEIDVGISGRVAGVVGEKMVRIADTHQVICITHLPQIAALADRHFIVEKQDDGVTTRTSAHMLDHEGRCRCIALMMDGNPESDTAYKHACELIGSSEAEKLRRRA